ncbi:MAG: hypothetical protein IJK63_09640 [Oscillospiraceae bacterium]|nr:hypothetical protein [Oscillospiraceae bacterium]
MKVTELKTGKLLDVNDSYGARLVEQGKAVPTPPVAEEVGAAFPQRSKNRRESESPNDFSGTARREAVPTQRQEKAAAAGAKNKPGKKAVENPSTACAVPLPLTGEA